MVVGIDWDNPGLAYMPRTKIQELPSLNNPGADLYLEKEMTEVSTVIKYERWYQLSLQLAEQFTAVLEQ